MESNNKVTYVKYTKEDDGTGCVLVLASGVGCIAVCEDHGHADYVIRCLKSGKLKMGAKGLERCNDA